MKITEQQFSKASEEFARVSLTEEQKSAMLSHIYRKAEEDAAKKPLFSSWSFSYTFAYRSLGVLTLTMIVLGGTAYAAELSLPGDLLYPLKTQVIEPAVMNLIIDKKGKEKYQAELSNKRLLEREEMQRQGRLTDTKDPVDDVIKTDGEDINQPKEAVSPTKAKVGAGIDNGSVKVNAEVPVSDGAKIEINQTNISDKETIEKLNEDIVSDLSETVTKKIDDTNDTTNKVADEVVGAVEEITTPVVPVVEEVPEKLNKTINPVVKGLGL